MQHSLEIILYQPQIPQNTGNIVRTCAVTGTRLTLVKPLGFSTASRWLKRAGLDYWENVEIQEIDDLHTYLEQTKKPFYFFTSKASTGHFSVDYPTDCQLIFGSETTGIPVEIMMQFPERMVKIPMLPDARCLNLATSVGIGVYEAIRQVMKRPATPAVGSP